jgi:hypothetical protein
MVSHPRLFLLNPSPLPHPRIEGERQRRPDLEAGKVRMAGIDEHVPPASTEGAMPRQSAAWEKTRLTARGLLG